MIFRVLIVTGIALVLTGGGALAAVKSLDDCNVVWGSPSGDSFGSMPLGNGDVGLNVWVEHNGDLVFYVSKVDAFDAEERAASSRAYPGPAILLCSRQPTSRGQSPLLCRMTRR